LAARSHLARPDNAAIAMGANRERRTVNRYEEIACSIGVNPSKRVTSHRLALQLIRAGSTLEQDPADAFGRSEKKPVGLNEFPEERRQPKISQDFTGLK
jgi:hypothetical protein